MALTGIEIFPRNFPRPTAENCGGAHLPGLCHEAGGQPRTELAACPYVSEQAQGRAGGSLGPPHPPHVHRGGRPGPELGGETVMFRHEKRFVSPTGSPVLVS